MTSMSDANKIAEAASIVCKAWGIDASAPRECLRVVGMCGASVAASEVTLGHRLESAAARKATRAWNVGRVAEMGVDRIVGSKGYHTALPAVRRELVTAFTQPAPSPVACNDAVATLLLHGLADEWSATRKIASKAFTHITPSQHVIDELRRNLASAQWRVLDGTLQALNVIYASHPLPWLYAEYCSMRTAICEETLSGLCHYDRFKTAHAPPPLEIFLAVTRHVGHEQPSVSENSAAVVLTLAKNSTALFVVRLFEFMMSLLAKTPSPGVFLILEGLVPCLPHLCIADMVRSVGLQLSSASSVIRQSVSSTLLACCRDDRPGVALAVHDVMLVLKSLLGPSRTWVEEEGALFVLEELLLSDLLPRKYLATVAKAVMGFGDKFEVKRMRSQVVPHLAANIVRNQGAVPCQDICTSDELIFWVIWKGNALGIDVGTLATPAVSRSFWGVCRQLALGAYVTHVVDSGAVQHLGGAASDSNSTAVLSRLLPDVVPWVTRYSDLAAIVACISGMLANTVDVHGACNLLEALRRCAVLLKGDGRVVFAASPVLNTTSVTASDKASWGDVMRRETSVEVRMEEDTPRETIQAEIVRCCCSVLSKRNTETSICKAALKVITSSDIRTCAQQLIESIKERMRAEGYSMVNGTVMSPTVATLHDWDKESDEDSNDANSSDFISKWKADLAACILGLDPLPDCEVTKWLLT
eukprot:TRINITY_DN5696_c0_g2_i4.p1 TRINITY_DN5696_c0_g2~~TRINITY_DN5696_c0_g2_i4.p1  ORF type:complete len:701 (+),score=214.24 TRINITY_DN5696_c0_g2_i4:872-2974(+)